MKFVIVLGVFFQLILTNSGREAKGFTDSTFIDSDSQDYIATIHGHRHVPKVLQQSTFQDHYDRLHSSMHENAMKRHMRIMCAADDENIVSGDSTANKVAQFNLGDACRGCFWTYFWDCGFGHCPPGSMVVDDDAEDGADRPVPPSEEFYGSLYPYPADESSEAAIDVEEAEELPPLPPIIEQPPPLSIMDAEEQASSLEDDDVGDEEDEEEEDSSEEVVEDEEAIDGSKGLKYEDLIRPFPIKSSRSQSRKKHSRKRRSHSNGHYINEAPWYENKYTINVPNVYRLEEHCHTVYKRVCSTVDRTVCDEKHADAVRRDSDRDDLTLAALASKEVGTAGWFAASKAFSGEPIPEKYNLNCEIKPVQKCLDVPTVECRKIKVQIKHRHETAGFFDQSRQAPLFDPRSAIDAKWKHADTSGRIVCLQLAKGAKRRAARKTRSSRLLNRQLDDSEGPKCVLKKKLICLFDLQNWCNELVNSFCKWLGIHTGNEPRYLTSPYDKRSTVKQATTSKRRKRWA